MSESSDNLANQMALTAAAPQTAEIGSNLAEAALDCAFEDGLFKEIPIVGSLVAIGKGVVAVRDRLFLKKLGMFLRHTCKASNEDKTKFQEKIKTDPKYRQRVGEGLLLLLERHSDVLKSEILGEVFRHLVSSKITEDQFNRVAQALDMLSVKTIEDAMSSVQSGSPDPNRCIPLVNAGLLEMAINIKPKATPSPTGVKMENATHFEFKQTAEAGILMDAIQAAKEVA